MRIFLTVVRRIWLPLFLFTSLSWLFAPLLYHDHYGVLHLISFYETGTTDYGWVFRVNDAVAGLLLGVSPWIFGYWRRAHLLSWLIMTVGLFSAFDGIFDNVCLKAGIACQGWALVSSWIHDTETVMLAVLLVVLGLYHAWRYRRWQSLVFVALQLAIGLVDISGLLDAQAIIISQYAYEVVVVSWLAWLVSTFAPLTYSRYGGQIRRVFGLWTLLNGAFLLIITLTHHRIFAPLYEASLAHGSALIGQHGMIAGVLMLYLARHVYQGQRRAALLLLIVLGSQVVKYSVVTPSFLLLSINLVSFVLLLYARHAFDRNIVALPWTSRLKDTAIVLSGAVIAVSISILAVAITGHGAVVQDGLIDTYQGSLHAAHHDFRRFQREENHRARVVQNTLLVALIGITAWSLFRPARLAHHTSVSDAARAKQLLTEFSNNTEDYFKLWPSDKSYYFAAQGFVAYKRVGGIAFALPDPIGPHREQLLVEFMKYCRDHGWAVCFLAVPESSLPLYTTHLKSLKMGSSAVITIKDFMRDTSHDKWWRWQNNRGTKAGLQYELCAPPHSSELMTELQQISDGWLADGEHREQVFALGYFDETYLQACRVHVLRDADNQLLAFANELPVYGLQAQRTVDMMRYLPGQNGSMPFLLLKLIEQLDHEGQAETFDLGYVPLAQIDSVLVKALRRLASGRFSSLGLEQFKNKFDPTWQASYLAYEGDLADLARIATSLETLLKKSD